MNMSSVQNLKNRLTMLRMASLSVFALSISVVSNGCGGPTGPDQKLNVPKGWTISDHSAGDIYFSRWTLDNGKGTKMEITSFVLTGAPKDVTDKFDVWKKYIEESVQYGQFMTRMWSVKPYGVTRYYAFATPNDKEHGSADIWLSDKNREFAISITNPDMKRVPMIELAEKVAEEIARDNQPEAK